MKLCIFPGTFNPIHKAHLSAAEYALKNFGFDKIIFIPAYKPPHKNYDLNLCKHRFNMVQLAIKNNPDFMISDIEYKNEGKSYSYLMVLELYKMFDIDGKINFIIGTDAFRNITNWYDTDKIKELVNFIVFPRENTSVNLDYLKEKGYNFRYAKMKYYDISSTDIRKRAANGESISDYVTKEVDKYIYENRLFKN